MEATVSTGVRAGGDSGPLYEVHLGDNAVKIGDDAPLGLVDQLGYLFVLQLLEFQVVLQHLLVVVAEVGPPEGGPVGNLPRQLVDNGLPGVVHLPGALSVVVGGDDGIDLRVVGGVAVEIVVGPGNYI